MMFNQSTLTWSYATKYNAGWDSGGGAGCWLGMGPADFNDGTSDCSYDDDVCQEVYVTTLGVFVPPVFWPGPTYYFGATACWPASDSRDVTTCGCVSGVGETCSIDGNGSPCGVTQCDGSCDQSGCSSGGSGGCATDICNNACGTSNGNGTCNTSDCNTSCSCYSGIACGGCGMYDCGDICNDPCAGGGGDPCSGVECAEGASCQNYWGTPECFWDADPVLIDLSGSGFLMTDAQHGVRFDFFGTGTPLQVSWTQAGAQDGWLALDLNRDGKIDNGQELFGNAMPSPGPAGTRLGFKALAVYDTRRYGGNGDGVIDAKDAIYSRLRVWVDKNHNGVTDPGELMTLQQAGIKALSVNYQQVSYTDVYGNQFRYRASVVWTNPKKNGGPWAYDVILVAPGLPLKGGK